MAKAQQKPAPTRPAAIPAGWGQMSAEEKRAWREKNQPASLARPVGPPKNYGPSMGVIPPGQEQLGQEQLGQQQPGQQQPGQQQPGQQQPGQQQPGQQQPGQQQPGYDELADQVADDVARQMSNQDARSFAAKILRAVADALDGGVGLE